MSHEFRRKINRFLGDNGGLSYNKTGVVSTTYSDNGVVKGIARLINASTTIGSSATINFLLDLSANDESVWVFALPIGITTSSQTIELRVYEDTDYSGGSSVTVVNPNRRSNSTINMVVKAGATGSDKGNLLITKHAFANFLISGQTEPYSFIILDNTKKYLVEIENQGGTSTTVDYSSLLFES